MRQKGLMRPGGILTRPLSYSGGERMAQVNMFRFFENLVDPLRRLHRTRHATKAAGPFFRATWAPVSTVFWVTAYCRLVVAAIEIGLIYYMGRIVDLMDSSPPRCGP